MEKQQNKDYKEILSYSGMSEEDFLSKIRSDLDRGDAAMSQLRLDMDADMKLYRSQKKNAKKEKIGDYTVFSTHSALMAMSYINQPESSFSTDSVSIDEMAKVNNLNAAYKDDFNRTDMEIVKYWQDFWKFMTGVSITARTGWDGENKSNKFEAVDTRYWIPDPDGDYLTGEYSYNGFYKNMYESKLRDMGIWNDDLNKHDTNSMTFDPEKSDKTGGGMLDQGDATSENSDAKYKIQYYFGCVNPKNKGKKAKPIKIMAIVGNSGDKLLAVKKIDFFPFSFKYWSPDGTITGMRVSKITGDVQRVKAEIANLRLDKSKSELYPMWIRNSRMIPNASDLEFGLNKVIDANPLEGQSVKDGLIPLQKDYRVDQSFIIDNSLDRNVMEGTAVNNVSKGSSPERREAVGVVNEMMDGTDTIMMFRAKVEAWGEKQMLRIYLEGMKQDFKKGDKKKIKVASGYGTVVKTVTKSDFIFDDIEIKIVTALEKEKTKKELQASYGNAIGMVAELGLSESAKKFMYRDFFEVMGLSPEKAERIVDYTPDEIEAISMVGLLNQNIMVQVKPHFDPMTHMSAIKSAKPGLNVDLYRRGLLSLYRKKGGEATQGQQEQQGQNNESIRNNMAAQASSSFANQSSQLNSNQ